MNAKFSGVFSVGAIICLLLHDLHNCTFKFNPTFKNLLPSNLRSFTTQFQNYSLLSRGQVTWYQHLDILLMSKLCRLSRDVPLKVYKDEFAKTFQTVFMTVNCV